MTTNTWIQISKIVSVFYRTHISWFVLLFYNRYINKSENIAIFTIVCTQDESFHFFKTLTITKEKIASISVAFLKI